MKRQLFFRDMLDACLMEVCGGVAWLVVCRVFSRASSYLSLA